MQLKSEIDKICLLFGNGVGLPPGVALKPDDSQILQAYYIYAGYITGSVMESFVQKNFKTMRGANKVAETVNWLVERCGTTPDLQKLLQHFEIIFGGAELQTKRFTAPSYDGPKIGFK